MARNLTRDGVEGLRWVLLEPLEGSAGGPAAGDPPGAAVGDTAGLVFGQAAGPATQGTADAVATARSGGRAASPPRVPAPPRADADRRTTPRQTLMLGGLKTLVLLLALGAAVATAWRVIGAPRYPGDGLRPAARPANPVRPAASVPAVHAGSALRAQDASWPARERAAT